MHQELRAGCENAGSMDPEMKRSPIKRGLPPKRFTPLRRSSRKRKPEVRIGKLGIVRLNGRAMTALRRARFEFDGYRCVDCGRQVAFNAEESLELRFPVVGHLSHVHAKRNNGDTFENTRTRCPECHQKSHNCGGKPLERKDWNV